MCCNVLQCVAECIALCVAECVAKYVAECVAEYVAECVAVCCMCFETCLFADVDVET